MKDPLSAQAASAPEEAGREPGIENVPDNETEPPLEDLDPDRIMEETDNVVEEQREDPL